MAFQIFSTVYLLITMSIKTCSLSTLNAKVFVYTMYVVTVNSTVNIVIIINQLFIREIMYARLMSIVD